MPDSEQILKEGRIILDPLLREHGFEFKLGAVGKGSGGRFARGSYVRNDRRLDMSYRYSLGHVTYHVGGLSISHDTYVRAISGDSGAYPGFSSDPLDGFRHLRDDLSQYGQVFLSGSAETFEEVVKQAKPRPSGFKALSHKEET